MEIQPQISQEAQPQSQTQPQELAPRQALPLGPQPSNGRQTPEGKPNPYEQNRSARREAAIAALRGERGVPEPTPVPQRVEQPVLAEQPVQQTPLTQQPDIAALLAQHEARIKTASEIEARAQATQAKAEADAKAAAEAKTKIDRALTDPEAYLEQLAATGMSEDEWVNFLSNGGKMSPEQKRIKELEARLAQTEKRTQDTIAQFEARQAEAMKQATVSQIQSSLNQYPLTSRMGGANAILIEQANLAKQGKQVSWQEAAQSYEARMLQGFQGMLQHEDVRDILKVSVNQSTQTASVVSKSPSTLNKTVSSSTAPTPDRPAPLDFEAKKARALQLIALSLADKK